MGPENKMFGVHDVDDDDDDDVDDEVVVVVVVAAAARLNRYLVLAMKLNPIETN